MSDAKIFLMLFILIYLTCALFGGQEVWWDYPAEPAGDPPTEFRLYRTLDLTQPFELFKVVPYNPGQTNYSVDVTGPQQSFFKLSAANTAGETFSLRREK